MADIDTSTAAIAAMLPRIEDIDIATAMEALLFDRNQLHVDLAILQKEQKYLYIGKDFKPILARDLEDQRDAAIARAEQAEARNHWFRGVVAVLNSMVLSGEKHSEETAEMVRATLAKEDGE